VASGTDGGPGIWKIDRAAAGFAAGHLELTIIDSRRASVSDPEETIDRKIFDQVRSPLAGGAAFARTALS